MSRIVKYYLNLIHKETFGSYLPFKKLIIAAAGDIFMLFIFLGVIVLHFSEKIRLDISCESSAKQTIHLKCQVLFSLKNNKKLECPLLQFYLTLSGLKVGMVLK